MGDSGLPVEEAASARQVPRRIALVRRGTSAQVRLEGEAEEQVMTFPHLIVREVVTFQVLLVALAVLALAFDAPLEWMANPEHTPNPAKAPWYFLGLQELLHYFPPVVAGVLIPTLVVIALAVIPYMEVNVIRAPLWQGRPRRTLLLTTGMVTAVLAMTLPFGAYPIAVPSLIVCALLSLAYRWRGRDGRRGWLAQRSTAEWVMTWFVIVAVTLTAIGVLFRGPGWRWSWPWVEGIY